MKNHSPDDIIQHFIDRYSVARLKADNVVTMIKNRTLRKLGHETPNTLSDEEKDHILKLNGHILLKTMCDHFNKEYFFIPCGKRILSKDEAHSAVAQSLLARGSHRKEQRYYFCKFCDGYHLSSKKFDPSKRQLNTKITDG